MEINGGLVRFLTAVAFGGAARGTVDQRVPLIRAKSPESGRLVHIHRVEIAHAVIRPGRPSWIVHAQHSDLVIVFAARRERLRSLRRYNIYYLQRTAINENSIL